MKITHEILFDRIQNDPITHLGGLSPELIDDYFFGYDLALSFHRRPPTIGRLSSFQMIRWFAENVYEGSQNVFGVCVLKTNSEEDALALYFEFRKLALKKFTDITPGRPLFGNANAETTSLLEMLKHEALRTRPAMYFANEHWLRSMWAFCNGYLWAEADMGIKNSKDRNTLNEFQAWLDKRYPFAEGANWGKLFTFLGLGSNKMALERFYDAFDSFLEGIASDAPTKACQGWIDACVADVLEKKKNGEL